METGRERFQKKWSSKGVVQLCQVHLHETKKGTVLETVVLKMFGLSSGVPGRRYGPVVRHQAGKRMMLVPFPALALLIFKS